MFSVYHSNQLDILKDLTAHLIRMQPLSDPFAKEVVLVQSPGMAQWLQMALADEFSIAANIEFPLPATFIWQMFMQVLPGIPRQSAFNKSAMSWKLMTLLPEMLARDDFLPLRHYLNDDDDKRKLFQLSSRIADLFDQYLVYRPDWLNQWQQQQLVEGLGDAQQWQAPLWRALVEYTAELGQPEWHRANLYSRFIQALESCDTPPPGLPPRVFICGISALPPVYLQALQALGRHIDIHLLFTNPCRDYWGDIRDRTFLARLQHRQRQQINSSQQRPVFREPEQAASLFNEDGEQQLTQPLLASWGKLGRDNLYLLAQMDALDNEIDAFAGPGEDSLLHCLQQDILTLEDHSVSGLTSEQYNHSGSKRRLSPEDDSFSLRACHSPQREVEVLQDYLLGLMEADPQLKPRDIIVMVADIDSYSPFIQSVFNGVNRQRHIPFAISDRRASQAHPVIQAFLQLLSLPDSRFTSEDVLALLEVPALAARFSINEQGLRTLRHWVDESGVRWGLDDSSVSDLSLPVTGQHTWQFGLQRMLLGYALESEQGDWQGILPYDESAGLMAELAGQLAELLSCLADWRQRLRQSLSLRDWQPCCREMIDTFFSGDTDSETALALIDEQWRQLTEQGIEAQYPAQIPVTILRDELRSLLDQQRISQRFLAGQVNFCTLMPMRSIPFKVVCLLGMNDGVYPRTLTPSGFDLMQQSTRRGDRSRRDDDRYLFLEALVSARDRLYISYIGRSIQDNRVRLPSVLVSELCEYISQSFCLPGDEALNVDDSAQQVLEHLLHQHSRTPFAAENFMPQAARQSFASEWLPSARGQGEALPSFVQPLAEFCCDEISLEELLRFWRHPVRAWFTRRLGVSFLAEEDDLPDTEPFVLDNLQRYQINSQLLNALIYQQDSEQFFQRQRMAGHLPYGPFGALFREKQLADMQEIASQVSGQLADTRSIEVDLELQVRLTGWLTGVQDDGILRWRPGELNLSDGLLLWIEHVVYCALGYQGISRMYGRKNSGWRFLPLPPEQALQQLEQLIDGFLQGMNQPLLLLNRCGGSWLTSSLSADKQQLLTDEETRRKALQKLTDAWQGSFQVPGEGSDPYLQRLCREPGPQVISEICAAAGQWYLPVIRAHVAE
ncbi:MULTISPECIES: exodeoxyribonuclease V subunit gamma [Tatumella]|uniref:RecBCD enzyme subunit RecC n=1 Tax=Tatumella punctata TaxID=399969 RepID=A0ABW1VP08_9GAMM|nr:MULTISPECIES: exodeoxyribonuclease V subunit gamma [unclassified Tatumella]MBS0876963.1 exodeoxyribonuclease V subunit gamma [Tatumella sp. JGM82]MBS0890900.1 exodeoxyribonuclease V subunit gamma [Tatumella sp. JGM94]MBS0901855.1 exodeoxyribonuclease V subunit gamma [Tatumella sp. JGM100]